MNKILILIFLIITFSVKSQSIDKAIVDKTIEYIGDCVKPEEIKKTSIHQNLDKNRTKFYTNFDKFNSIIKAEFINTYSSFTRPLIDIKNESDSNYFVFTEKLIEKNNEKFEKYFASDVINEFKKQKSDNEGQNYENVNQINKLNKSKKIGYAVIILLLFLLIFFVFKNQKTIEIKKEQKDKKTDKPNINQRSPYELENEKHKEHIKTLILKIEDLESKLSDLKSQNNNEIIVVFPDDEIGGGSIPPTLLKQYYLLAPIANKTFSDEHKSSDSVYGNSMFLFTISEKETYATFEFCGDNRVLSYVMDFPDESIERVCEYGNSKTEFKSEIITIKPGEAELRGGKWIVIKPAKIKFQ